MTTTNSNSGTRVTDTASSTSEIRLKFDWLTAMPRFYIGQEVGILRGRYKYRVGKIVKITWNTRVFVTQYEVKLYDSKKRLMKGVIHLLPLEIEPANKNKK